MIEIIPKGSRAVTKIGEISGIITACTIRGNLIRYEFSYFNNGEYKDCWMDECEFTLIDELKQKIGFKQDANS